MSTIEERTAYLDNPFFTKHLYGDFSPFYITIGICTAFGVLLILLNVICGCCSRYSDYWLDRYTGNRWLITLWTSSPHKQPPLDLKELKSAEEIYHFKQHHVIEVESPEQPAQLQRPPQPQPQHQRPPRPEHLRGLLKKAQQEQQVELQTRESDI